MACPSPVKPFSPNEAYTIVHQLQQPAVFLNMAKDWPVLRWTAQRLALCLKEKAIKFRLGKKHETNTPLFETRCSFVSATLGQFWRWAEGEAGADVGAFAGFAKAEYWAYADYKYVAEVFEDEPSMFEDVKWSDFGFEGRGGRESTLWIGTEGAHTPCHLDSYGCNLVLQVQGRKRWHLFPPEDTSKLYPTRIPYEESSVFSRVDVQNPDLSRFRDFSGARAHRVTLLPGQVLFVPRHWWHFVESVDPVTVSVNSWIELDADDEARVSEAVTRAVVCAFKTAGGDDNEDDWLNPTEAGVSSHCENMQYLNLALTSFAQKHSSSSKSPPHVSHDTHPAKRVCTGHTSPPSSPLSPPFGPHLTAVCQQLPVDSAATEKTRKCARAGLEMARPEGASVLDRGGERAGPGRSQEANEEAERVRVSTNDLLDCLVHPDVMERVTELLIRRRGGDTRTPPD